MIKQLLYLLFAIVLFDKWTNGQPGSQGYIIAKNEDKIHRVCGGTKIGKFLMATTADCIWEKEHTYFGTAGFPEAVTDEELNAGFIRAIHSKYKSGQFYAYNVGILIFQEEVSEAIPAVLLNKPLKTGHIVIGNGYGINGIETDVTKFVKTTRELKTMETLNIFVGCIIQHTNKVINDKSFCAELVDKKKDHSCAVDLGGPIYKKDENSEENQLAAIIVTVTNCFAPVVGISVAHPEIYSWMNHVQASFV